MLLNLNDDCLEYICEFLDISEQTAVKNVCQRLDEIIQSIWQRKMKKIIIKKKDSVYFKKERNSFLHFMMANCKLVENLNLGDIDEEEFHLVRNLKFLHCTTFECQLWREDDDLNDDNVIQIAKMFPNLTKLTISSQISGEHIAFMHNLKELNLMHCKRLDPEQLKGIFSTLKLRKFGLVYHDFSTLHDESISAITLCNTLEELEIDDFHLILLDDFFEMPNLTKITCYTTDHSLLIMHEISHTLGRRMHTMICHDVIWAREEYTEYLKKMHNLKKLIFYKDYIEENQLNQIAEHLPKLHEFRYIKGLSANEEDLLSVLENNRQLEIFDISHTQVSSTFLHDVIAIIKKQQRLMPLQFYCFNTVIANTAYENLELPSTICINTNEQRLQLPNYCALQFEWHAENKK